MIMLSFILCLNNIYGNTPIGKLKNKLIKNSPLSDTVLIALITEYPLSHGNFKNVMQINLPVSKKAETYFYERNKLLPLGIAKQLMGLQADNPGVTTLTSIQNEIDLVTMDRQLYLNNLIITLLDTLNNRKADAIILLEAEGTVHADQALAATYLNDGNYTDAANKLNDIPTDNIEVYDWLQLSQILLSLYQENKSVYELDSLDIVFIPQVANSAYRAVISIV